MIIWILCAVFGLATISFIPALLAGSVAFFSSVGKKYPKFADVGSGIVMFIAGLAFLVEVMVLASVYHHLWQGTP